MLNVRSATSPATVQGVRGGRPTNRRPPKYAGTVHDAKVHLIPLPSRGTWMTVPRTCVHCTGMTGFNLCRRCGKDKSCTDFARDKKNVDGLQSYCKPCASEKSRLWYQSSKLKRSGQEAE